MCTLLVLKSLDALTDHSRPEGWGLSPAKGSSTIACACKAWLQQGLLTVHVHLGGVQMSGPGRASSWATGPVLARCPAEPSQHAH